MKKLIFTLFILACSSIILAQQVDISPEQTVREKLEYEIIGKVKNSVLMYRADGTDYELQGYDDLMRKDWDEVIEFERKAIKTYGFTRTKEDFTQIYSYRRKGKMYVSARQYDGKGKVMRVDTLTIVDRRAFMPNFTYIESQNKRLVMLYHVEKNKEIEALVFDTRYRKVLWNKVFKPVELDFRLEFVNALLDNDGNPHFVFGKDNKRSKKETNRFEVFSYVASTESEMTTLFPFKEYLWFDVHFAYDNRNNKLVGGGLYSDKYRTVAKGYFYMSMDLYDDDIRTLEYHPFTPEYIKEVLGKEKIKKSEAKGFSDIEVREIVLRSDGGILLIIERIKENMRESFNYASSYGRNYRDTNYKVDYFFNDALLFSINPNGSTDWYQVLHKRQFSQDDGGMYSSYFLLKTKQSLRFLYNDEIKQENVVNEYIVTGKEEAKRKNVLNTAGEKIMLLLKEAVQISSKEVVIPSQRRRTLKLVKVTF